MAFKPDKQPQQAVQKHMMWKLDGLVLLLCLQIIEMRCWMVSSTPRF